MGSILSIGVLIPIIIAVIAIVILLLTGYVKASPDEAIIISGLKSKPRVISGRASIKIPFFERKDRLSLKTIKIDVKTREPVPTSEFINVNVDAVVTAKISKDPVLLELASANFLNQSEEYIMNMITEVLEGNIREIVGNMELKSMVSNRQEFAIRVQENAVPDMRKMGIEIVSFNVQNFSDRNGVIEDLGIDNIAKIKQTAAIVKAESERNIAIAQVMADKESNDARVASEQEIAIKNNELEIKRADLKRAQDTQRAIADAAYEIQKEEQRKTIEITSANADLAKQAKEIELKEQEVKIEERTLEAKVMKNAEAQKYAEIQRADAELYKRQKDAEARTFEEEQKARALKAIATAEKEAEVLRAEGLRAVGLAEAEAIKAKALAEAEGIEKKAEAMLKMGEAAVLEMYFNILPEVAANVAKPLENVNAITMYGEGNTAKLVGDITNSVSQITEGLTNSLGIDMKTVLSSFLGGKVATSGNRGCNIQVNPPQMPEKTEETYEDVNE